MLEQAHSSADAAPLPRWPWFAGVLVFLVLATTRIDLHVAGLFHTEEEGWFLGEHWLPATLYDYGPYVAILIAVGSAIVLLGRRWVAEEARESTVRLAWIMLMTLVLGSGLIVNTVLKPNVGRARPRNVEEFGGPKGGFQPVFSLDHHRTGTSFPSGHASTGFYLATPYFPLRRRRRGLARFALGTGLFAGCLMGAGRIVQGGHYLADVFTSGLIMLGTAALVTRWFERRAGSQGEGGS